MSKLTDGEIEAFREKHGRTAVVDYLDHEFVIRKPSVGEYKLFRSRLYDEKKRSSALEDLTRSCIAHPEREVVAAFADEYPGMWESIGKHVVELGGMVDSELRK